MNRMSLIPNYTLRDSKQTVDHGEQKIVGLRWNSGTRMLAKKREPTKRNSVRMVSNVHDPIGILLKELNERSSVKLIEELAKIKVLFSQLCNSFNTHTQNKHILKQRRAITYHYTDFSIPSSTLV